MAVLDRFDSFRGVIALIGLLSVVLVAVLIASIFVRADNDAVVEPGALTSGSGAATLEVIAAEEADVRIWVDETVAFDGRLATGERRSWSGETRVRVWTSNAGALSVTVNSHDLGPLSQAVGHPEWSRIDWIWWAGWTPAAP